MATFRSDGAYSDGRHPDAVRYTLSAAEDVQRRDFTINGLLLDRHCGRQTLGRERSPSETLRNAVIDYVGGLADLDAGIVRAIGQPARRFEEDQSAHVARGSLCRALRIRRSSRRHTAAIRASARASAP